MTRPVTRVLALERRKRLADGCPLCRGQCFVAYDPATDELSWLDGRPCCRGCGEGVAAFHRDPWEQLR